MKRGKEAMRSTEKRREQKTSGEGYPGSEAVNPPKAKGAPSFSAARVAESPHEGEYRLMEKVVEKENMTAALKRVEQNKGAAGSDGIEVRELRSYLRGGWSTRTCCGDIQAESRKTGRDCKTRWGDKSVRDTDSPRPPDPAGTTPSFNPDL